ncbi:MAG: outer membrane protein [Bacteroidales bacterium]
MVKKLIVLCWLTLFLAPGVSAQEPANPGPGEKINHYSLAIGLGWVHYINTLDIGADLATINSPGLSLRFFWEPEHRLSLGLETGFYRLYKVKSGTDAPTSGFATMSAMPLLLAARMRIVDRFYLSAGAGLAAMFNKVSGIDHTISSTIISFSNFQFSASYIYPLSKHWQVGGELKFLNYGKTDDWIYSLQVFCAVRL